MKTFFQKHYYHTSKTYINSTLFDKKYNNFTPIIYCFRNVANIHKEFYNPNELADMLCNKNNLEYVNKINSVTNYIYHRDISSYSPIDIEKIIIGRYLFRYKASCINFMSVYELADKINTPIMRKYYQCINNNHVYPIFESGSDNSCARIPEKLQQLF
jgi:hypothetical protein